MTKIFYISFVFILLILLSSCKLHSLISENEFIVNNKLSDINGTYAVNQNLNDSLVIINRYWNNEFYILDMLKDKHKQLLKDKHIDNLTISYDGNKKITFSFGDGDDSQNFTYNCTPQGNYLEIYFTKRRIWALPLFMTYQYDRLRLGLDENSNLIVHKWYTNLATLTIMPFDSFGDKDYSYTLPKLSP